MSIIVHDIKDVDNNANLPYIVDIFNDKGIIRTLVFSSPMTPNDIAAKMVVTGGLSQLIINAVVAYMKQKALAANYSIQYLYAGKSIIDGKEVDAIGSILLMTYYKREKKLIDRVKDDIRCVLAYQPEEGKDIIALVPDNPFAKVFDEQRKHYPKLTNLIEQLKKIADRVTVARTGAHLLAEGANDAVKDSQ